ncbi:autotransporter outer membrane beta-barrel domain-containing protein [Acerihabitans sp. KWT182]|uniref:Autotransporter outer membrane beta-barrel domain-containing protein n=1 Tax=Acerihabitans sp. KWT182 TaxID=3157919 RepID=A0AAU7Q4U8_9GAMM
MDRSRSPEVTSAMDRFLSPEETGAAHDDVSERNYPVEENNPAGPERSPPLVSAAAPFMARQAPLRPEPGAYAANLAAANTLFMTGMHDRVGEPAYAGVATSVTDQDVPAMWLRAVGGRGKSTMANGGIATKFHSQILQLGGRGYASRQHTGGDGLHIGVMAGRAHSGNRSRAAFTGYEARGNVKGYALGLYGTWHHDDICRKGPYMDLSLHYGWFDNRVKGESLGEERYRSKGLTGAAEAGYHQRLFSGRRTALYLKPSLQIGWMGIRAAHTERNGDRFTLLGSGNIQSRLGGRLYLEKLIRGENDRLRLSKPYIETNWIHNTRHVGVGINGSALMQEGGKNLAEVKLGHEAQANSRLALWGNLGYQAGGGGFNNTVGTLGVKVRF